MRMKGVVIFHPFIAEFPHLFEVSEEISIQNIFAVSAIQSLHITILHRFAGLDKLKLYLLLVAKCFQGVADKFGTVIYADRLRFTFLPDDSLQYSDHAFGG